MIIYILILTVDCGSLTDPDNGSVHHTAGTTNGQTATYSCYTGYNLVGNSKLVWECTYLSRYSDIHKKHVNLALAYLVEVKLYGRV